MSEVSSSTVKFRHEHNQTYKLKGVKHTIKELIIDGDKGLSFMFLKKVGEEQKNFYKIYANEVEAGKFSVKETKGEKETETEMSEADVKKMLKGNKDLDFVRTWWEEKRGSYNGGAKKKSFRKMRGGNSEELNVPEEPTVPTEPTAPETNVQQEEMPTQEGGTKRRSKKSKKSSKKMSGGAKRRSKKTSKKSKKSSKKMSGGAKRRSKKGSKKN